MCLTGFSTNLRISSFNIGAWSSAHLLPVDNPSMIFFQGSTVVYLVEQLDCLDIVAYRHSSDILPVKPSFVKVQEFDEAMKYKSTGITSSLGSAV